MLNTMRLDAFKETGDRAYLHSSILAINVYKKNQLNSYELLYPKTYIFDASAFIIDHDAKGKEMSHLEDYKASWSMKDIKENVAISRWVAGDASSDVTMNNPNFSDDYRLVTKKGSKAWGGALSRAAQANLNDALLTNHLHDYAFKFKRLKSEGQRLPPFVNRKL